MTPRGYEAYNHAVVHTTDNKEQILLMLYDGAVRFVRFARMGIEKKNPKIRGENISKVLGILTELDCALDREGGGELVENLSDLYGYMMNRLTDANVKNDTDALNEVGRLLTELKEGFEGALQKEPKEAPVQPEIEEPGMQEGGIRLAV
ncbi:MAG: flagellar export chaperone FliS [Desulfobacterales bacterium]|nr:flagellar export chaperone FliS [Desulfobacterales bacterium]